MTTLCWFRTDLRIADQPALSAAASQGNAIALFIASPSQWHRHGDAPIKVDFWLRGLHQLKRELSALNIPLKWLVVDEWKDVPQALLAFCQSHGIDSVHCNREFGVNERRRDRHCYQILKENGIDMTGHHGGTLLIPGTVKTGSDSYYRVFTPFARACREKLRTSPYKLTASPKNKLAIIYLRAMSCLKSCQAGMLPQQRYNKVGQQVQTLHTTS